MKKIAVFLNEDKKLDNFYNCNTIMIYGGGVSECLVLDEQAFDKITPTSTRVIIDQTGDISEKVDDCSAIVFGEIAGVAYSVFDKAKFKIFTIEENSPDAIISIFRDLFELDKEIAKKKEALLELKPHETSEPGIYYFDLFTALQDNPEVSSKKMLKEFFDSIPFVMLKMKVNHMPPWIERDGRFNVASDEQQPIQTVVVTKKKCNQEDR